MWKFVQKIHAPKSVDEKQVRSFEIWYLVLVAFIVVWIMGAYVYLDKKTDVTIGNPPVVVLDAVNGVNLTNFFQVNSNQTQLYPKNPLPHPMFTIREQYEVGEIIVVKYFYVEAVVVEKQANDFYVVMYKDHNHVLQKLALPRAMLMYPAEGVLNPVSLLVD